ncbi:hypothetical protein JCM8208_006489 [Rhodotorula glutinis]
MSTIDLKLSHAVTGETRIVSLSAQPAPTWVALMQHIQQRFALDKAPTKVTYVDNDGDEITLSSDDELRELWLGSVTEPNLSLTFSVARPVDVKEHEPVRDAEQLALLDSVRVALEKDASLAHDVREVVHNVLAAPRHGHHHHHSHPHFGSRGNGGGRKGFGGAGGRQPPPPPGPPHGPPPPLAFGFFGPPPPPPPPFPPRRPRHGNKHGPPPFFPPGPPPAPHGHHPGAGRFGEGDSYLYPPMPWHAFLDRLDSPFHDDRHCGRCA